MSDEPNKTADPAAKTPDEPIGVPGGSYDVDEAFIEESGAGQALEEGKKRSS